MPVRPRHRAVEFVAVLLCCCGALFADAVQPNQPLSIPDSTSMSTQPSATPVAADVPRRRSETSEAVSAERSVLADVPLPPPPQEALPLGQPHPGRSAEPTRQGPEAGSWLVRTFAALVVVVALIVVLRVVVSRYGRAVGLMPSGKVVELIDRTPIAPRTHILLLKIRERIIVAAQSPGGINTLTEITDPQEVAWVLSQSAGARPMSITRSFSQMLQGFDRTFDRHRAAREEGGDYEEHLVDRTRDQVAGLLSRIRSMRQS